MVRFVGIVLRAKKAHTYVWTCVCSQQSEIPVTRLSKSSVVADTVPYQLGQRIVTVVERPGNRKSETRPLIQCANNARCGRCSTRRIQVRDATSPSMIDSSSDWCPDESLNPYTPTVLKPDHSNTLESLSPTV
jgi:hypothetical protein